MRSKILGSELLSADLELHEKDPAAVAAAVRKVRLEIQSCMAECALWSHRAE